MTVTEAIAQATALGLTLTVKDGMINVNGKRTPEVMALLEQMKPLKPALIAHLTAALEFTLDDVEPLPVEPVAPIRICTPKPPLPAEQWITGATAASAWAAFQTLKQRYFCAWGHDSTGYTVTCDAREFEVCK
jgi:hypothetical protein